jgi:ethanolamine ammonia-lyase small subunit
MNDIPLDPWSDFRTLTAARIALGRAGGSIPTRELLDFGLAHAQARDAVNMPFDTELLIARLRDAGLESVLLSSAADTRFEYLRRPDLGRRLSDVSRAQLPNRDPGVFDLCIVVSDGLSSKATGHAAHLVAALHSRLMSEGWKIAPVIVVPLARVAIQDEIGERLGAALSLILLGERPGLGSPDSLGAYFVHGPKVGLTDAHRNCVSNIRPSETSVAAAIQTLLYLLNAARHRKLSGVELKDERLLPQSGFSPPRSIS